MKKNSLQKKSIYFIVLVLDFFICSNAPVSVTLVDDATFFTYINLDYPGLQAVKAAVNAGDYTLAKAELLKYYQNRISRKFTELPDSGNIETADKSVAHNFRFSGSEGKYFFVGANIDWHTSLSTYSGWVYGFNYHEWMPNLGAAYVQTKDEKYAKEWIYEITDWVNECSYYHPGENPNDWNSFLAAGERMKAWIKTYQYFINIYTSPSINSDQHIAILKSIKEHAEYLNSKDQGGNHGTTAQIGLFEVTVMFPEFKDAKIWQTNAVSKLESHIIEDIRSDGSALEQSPDYQALMCNSYAIVYNLSKLNSLNAFSVTFIDRLQKGYEYQLFITKPDKWHPTLGDTEVYHKNNDETIAAGAEMFNREDMKYSYTSGVSGTIPTTISKDFPVGGVYIMRSSWGTAANFNQPLYLCFLVGPYGGWHDHFDWLSFEAYAYGKDLIVDPGLFTYDETIINGKNWHYFAKSTRSHNTIEVEGKDQLTYVSGYRYGPLPDYKTKEWVTNKGFDFVDGMLASQNYDVIHERKIFFVRNEYWIISDLLTYESTPHTYDLYFHLPAISLGNTTINEATKTVNSSGNNLMIIPSDPTTLSGSIIDDWVNNQETKAPTVKYSKSLSGNTHFETVIYPYATTKPAINLSRLEVKRGVSDLSPYQASGLKIDIGSISDYYFIANDTTVLTNFGQFEFDGNIAYLRKDSTGTIINVQIKDGTELKENGKVIVKSNISLKELGAEKKGKVLNINAPHIGKLSMYAPEIKKVIFNGKEKNFDRKGSNIILVEENQ